MNKYCPCRLLNQNNKFRNSLRLILELSVFLWKKHQPIKFLKLNLLAVVCHSFIKRKTEFAFYWVVDRVPIMHIDCILSVYFGILVVVSSCLGYDPNSFMNITDKQTNLNERTTLNDTAEKGLLRLCCEYGHYATIWDGEVKSCDLNETAKNFNIEISDKSGRKFNLSSQNFRYVKRQCENYYYPPIWKIFRVWKPSKFHYE